MMKARVLLNVFLVIIIGNGGCQYPGNKAGNEQVSFSSDKPNLNAGFEWAKKQAMQYVFENDTVGKWYEASLPGRNAFCMRDVSHQCIGAEILGLSEYNKNMMQKFAVNIAESRDYCSYWEINKEGLPAPADYENDSSFWYNLPANFDILDACYRLYQWTADTGYYTNADLVNFYSKTTTEYVDAWDEDDDGIMESPKTNWPRGIPTYWESDMAEFVTGSDLVASMYAGFYVYSKFLSFSGDTTGEKIMKQKADTLQAIFNSLWWNDETKSFNTGKRADGSYVQDDIGILRFYPLYHELIIDKDKIAMVLNKVNKVSNVEEGSYLPEIFYRYNQNVKAFRYLMMQLDPNLERRSYPEVSFAAIASITTGLMGIRPHASQNLIETFPRLTDEVTWAEMNHVPVLQNKIFVRHTGIKETQFTNLSGNEIKWQASFPIISNVLNLNGESTGCERTYRKGQNISYLIVKVKPGETYTVSVPF